MKRFLFAAVTALALLWCTVSVYAADLPVAAWVMRDGAAVGLAGAAFSLSTPAQDREPVILVTDETGRLVFRDLEEGSYELRQTEAPGLYRPLARPLSVELSSDGTLTVEGQPTSEVSVLHRSGRSVLTVALVAVLSLLPMALRLLWLHRRDK